MPTSVHATPAELLALIEAEQSRLRDLLAGYDASLLARRPPNGDWSVIENLRHLLFSEQLHLGPLAPQRIGLSPLGLAPAGLRRQKRLAGRFAGVGSNPSTDVAEILAAWQEAHALIRPALLVDSPKVLKGLNGNLRHLRTHIKVMRRLLRAATTAGALPEDR